MNPIVLEAKNLRVEFRRQAVLGDLSVSLLAGEVVGIIGPNGSGKSTLLRALAGLIRPTSGTVSLAGMPLRGTPNRERARKLAITMPTDWSDCTFTVESVVMLGRAARRGWFLPMRAEDRVIVKDCLARTGLTDLADRQVRELSSGESQRVAIAQALAQQPEVILCDEPTSHLDLRHTVVLLELIQQLARTQNLGVIVVLHDLTLAARFCDRILALKDGECLVEGEPAAVLTSEWLTRVYDVPVRVVREADDLFVIPTR